MISERLAAHVAAAEQAQHWLRQRGARVVDFRMFARRPMLEITCPPAQLVAEADRIVEMYQGGTRSVWVATVNNCRVIWR
ncbi:TPA: hypothetical protein IGZ61_002266 [Escherichia coli]|nr:hypothetical protein [Escherichia coli]